MSAKRSPKLEKFVKLHRNGTVWAKGQTLGGVPTGRWEFFRKDGTRMGSGSFVDGEKSGKWTTYDAKGRVFKVTTMRPKASKKPRAAASSVDFYLASLPKDKRSALGRLRATIRRAVPGGEECISYGLPAVRLEGKVLVLFGATAGHCAFYPGSGTAVAAHRAALEGHETSKGAIRFQPGEPIPDVLVRRIVAYRVRENASGRKRGTKAAAVPRTSRGSRRRG